jgi:hypothetical protein
MTNDAVERMVVSKGTGDVIEGGVSQNGRRERQKKAPAIRSHSDRSEFVDKSSNRRNRRRLANASSPVKLKRTCQARMISFVKMRGTEIRFRTEQFFRLHTEFLHRTEKASQSLHGGNRSPATESHRNGRCHPPSRRKIPGRLDPSQERKKCEGKGNTQSPTGMPIVATDIESLAMALPGRFLRSAFVRRIATASHIIIGRSNIAINVNRLSLK